MNDFPHHSYNEIYKAMTDRGLFCCRVAKLEGKGESCGLCNHRLEILIDQETHEPRSFISTKLAGELLSSIETAELGPMPKPTQSGAATTSNATPAKPAAPKSAGTTKRPTPKVTGARVAALEASIQAGEEDVCRQIRELHIELRNGLRGVQRKQGGAHEHGGREQERGRLPTTRNACDKRAWRNCPNIIGGNNRHDPLLVGDVQVDGETGLSEETTDSGASMSGVSDKQHPDGQREESVSLDGVCDISDDGDDVNPGPAGKMVIQLMESQLVETHDNTRAPTAVQEGEGTIN